VSNSLDLLNHPKNGVHLRLLFAVTLVYLGNMQPSMRTSISVWWFPTKTAGLMFSASSPVMPPSRFMLPVTRKVTPVVIHMLHLNDRPTVHWLSPPYPTSRRTMLAKMPYEADARSRMKAVRVKAAKDTSCAGPEGRTREMRRRNMIRAAGEAAR
jgi:hypothetical protein